MFKTFALLFVLAGLCAAQPLSFGVKLGVPAGDAFDVARNPGTATNYFTGGGQFIVGPSAELRLPFGLGLEGDILYTRFNFSSQNILGSGGNSNSFEFPILAKYRFAGFGPARLLVGAGPSFRRLQSVLNFDPRKTNDAGGRGVVFAGGLEVKLLFLKIAPELRYTHWGEQNFLDGANALIHARQNQGQFLLGISF
jgi:hypothetical protein